MNAALPRTRSRISVVRGRALGLSATLAAALAAGLAACAPPPTAPSPRETAVEAVPDGGRLPPIPSLDGPLDLRVSYPRDSLFIATRGATFIFGSAGSGRARVWVNGREVEVQPNGGFLAFLPVPEDGVYRVRGTLDGRTQTVEVPVVLPPARPEPGGRALIVDASVYPSGAWVALPGETIEVGFTGTAGGEAWLELGDERVPLVPSPRTTGGATEFEVVRPGDAAGAEAPAPGAGGPASGLAGYQGFFSARPVRTADRSVRRPTLVTAADGSSVRPGPDPVAGSVVLALDGDTARVPLRLNLALADPARPRVGVAQDLNPAARNGDRRVAARVGPGSGPYNYIWANGVALELTGERSGAYRARLADGLHAWVPARQVQLQVRGTPPPRSAVTTVRLDPRPEHIDVHIALDRRLPYRVEEDDGSVSIVVYGATSRVNYLQHGRVDPYIDRAEWSQPADGVFRLDVRLTSMPWGYDTFWGAGDDLVLRLRRPPTIDPESPFRGLTIGVDPGHGGTDTLTMGPTGLTEAEANLGIALALRDQLERRGGRVVVSRTSDTDMSLVERTHLARAEDVDLWVSVHNNAFPDGVDPWVNNGTSVYYTHPRAAGLAWSVQESLLQELGLRDLGVGRADLHQPRFTWAPAILTENVFMMVPRQEAFLRTAGGRERVARATVRGIEAWLRALARAGDPARGGTAVIDHR